MNLVMVSDHRRPVMPEVLADFLLDLYPGTLNTFLIIELHEKDLAALIEEAKTKYQKK